MSMEVLGFDQGLSDASPMGDEAPERTGEEKKQAARRHFKQARKEARAPRRARGGDAGKAKPSAGTRPKGKAPAKTAKPAAKSAPGKAPANRARPAPKAPGAKGRR
jgi:23S rRNA pseudouridine955/2504/2580 synthase